MVAFMLALTPKQQKWVWVLTDFRVRKPSASNITASHEHDVAVTSRWLCIAACAAMTMPMCQAHVVGVPGHAAHAALSTHMFMSCQDTG